MLKSRLILAVPVALALTFTLAGPAAVADQDRDPGRAPAASDSGRRAGDDRAAARREARATLAEVEAVIDGKRPDGRTADGRSFTLALRDLAMLKHTLPTAERKRVDALLARPGESCSPSCNPDEYPDHLITDPLPLERCESVVCVHYTSAGNHAPSLTDISPANGYPDFIDQVLATVLQVHNDLLAAGYRRPKGDGLLGGYADVVDIYVGDIGDAGLYGYCTSDDPHNPNVTGDYSFWAYCTLDDDFAEFPGSPVENMRVTAAHEYFHAVQYAYDAWEDGWVLESTAAWVEDELFDDVNDNRQYLANSPLTKPYVPLDLFCRDEVCGALEGFHYGTWIWWRYLTERFPAKVGKLPKLVRDLWNRLDASGPGTPDRHSAQGLAEVLKKRKTSLPTELAKFYAANRRAKKFYSEGGSYPQAPADKTVAPTATKGVKLTGPADHLTSRTVRFNPKKLSKKSWKLRLTFSLPPKKRGSAAVVVVYRTNGKFDQSLVKLNKSGKGKKSVPFAPKTVKGVDVVLVNASARFTCWQGQRFSCQGLPKDDGLTVGVTGVPFR